MKAIKYTGIALGLLLTGFFAYANLRTISPTETIKDVHLTAFKVKGLESAEDARLLTGIVAATPGVTACAVNADGATASCLYHPDEVEESTLAKALSLNNRYSIEKMELGNANAPSCPVQGSLALYSSVLGFFTIR